MGKTVALSGPSLEVAQRLFHEHYRDHPPPPPPNYPRREFAYAPFSGSGMRRHIAIVGPEPFQQALAREVPRHAYYSSAYYEDPAHPIMVSKKWAGADLIFDLDADHLQDASGLNYPRQLELVRGKFLTLVEDYLFRDFGLSEADVTLVFSGGRGYHAHVHKSSFLGLGSAARREIVDYLGGDGADLGPYLGPLEKEKLQILTRPKGGAGDAPGPEGAPGEAPRERESEQKKKRTTSEIPKLPAEDAPGWKGRFTRSFFRLLGTWETMTVAEVTQDILERSRRLGVDTMRAEDAFTVAKALIAGGKAKKARENYVLDVGGKGRGAPIPFVTLVLREGAIGLQGETDAPVTTDIHRLIRLPGSLHGGTGFRVLPLAREQLRDFEPMRDALLPPSEEGPRTIRVRLTTGVDYPLGEDRVTGKEEEVLDLLASHALFLLLRGEAVVPAEG